MKKLKIINRADQLFEIFTQEREGLAFMIEARRKTIEDAYDKGYVVEECFDEIIVTKRDTECGTK